MVFFEFCCVVEVVFSNGYYLVNNFVLSGVVVFDVYVVNVNFFIFLNDVGKVYCFGVYIGYMVVGDGCVGVVVVFVFVIEFGGVVLYEYVVKDFVWLEFYYR